VKTRGCFERDTSSSKAARLRLLLASNIYGSMFSESESSGDGARRFRLGAELGVIASQLLVSLVCKIVQGIPFCLFLILCKPRSLDSLRTPKGCRAGVETVAIILAWWASCWQNG